MPEQTRSDDLVRALALPFPEDFEDEAVPPERSWAEMQAEPAWWFRMAEEQALRDECDRWGRSPSPADLFMSREG